jgi:hypothetical protein
VFRADGNAEPIMLADASFKIDPHTGKTQYGTLALVYGGPVIAVSKRIPYVALSTPHAELCAMNYAARTAAWLENVFEEIGEPLQEKTLLLGDNTVAVLNATEDIISEKNKCLQLAFHYIKERRDPRRSPGNTPPIHEINAARHAYEKCQSRLPRTTGGKVYRDRRIPFLLQTAKAFQVTIIRHKHLKEWTWTNGFLPLNF